MSGMTRRVLAAASFISICMVLPASAQETVRIRGTVERIEGPVYVVKNRDGAELRPFCWTGAHPPVDTRGIFLSLSRHETFALLICFVCSGGTGKPAVVYEGRAESCPSGFFLEAGARPYLNQMLANYSGTTQLWKADEPCDQAAVQSAYY